MRLTSWMRRLRWPLAVALLLGCAFVARVVHSSYMSEMNEFTHRPVSALIETPDAVGIAGLVNVSFPAHGGGFELAGWQVPSRNGAAVIVCHGTGAERSTMLAETRLLAEAGFGVLAFDWPGYGASGGVNNWGVSARQALIGAIDWLVIEQGIEPSRIGGYGFSMGGLIMTQVAADEPRLSALVLAAPVPDILWQSAYEHRKWGALSRWPAMFVLQRSGMPLDDAQPMTVVSRIAPRPLLLIVGADDLAVPAAKLGELFERARAPKEFWIVPGAGHGGYDRAAPAEYTARVAGFFTCHLLGQCPP